MARPRTPIGAYGNIDASEIRPGVWEADTRMRMANGRVKRVRRVGTSRTNAKNKLKEALARLVDEVSSSALNQNTRLARVAELWLEDLAREVKLGNVASKTMVGHTGYVANWLNPAVGELTCGEAQTSVLTLESMIKNAQDKRGFSTAKSLRSTASLVCGYAVRHGAMAVNPVKSIARLSGGTAKEPRALTADERTDLWAKLNAYAESRTVSKNGKPMGSQAQVWRDLPDIVLALLSTGGRISESLALTGDEVSPDGTTVTLDWHMIDVAGQGAVRQRLRKGNGRGLTLDVPSWSVDMWRRRRDAAGSGPLFPAWGGDFRSLSATQGPLREAFDACGYEWLTSHNFRKTVATELDRAGLTTTQIADQLGNTARVVEMHYREKRRSNPESVAALASMWGESADVG